LPAITNKKSLAKLNSLDLLIPKIYCKNLFFKLLNLLGIMLVIHRLQISVSYVVKMSRDHPGPVSKNDDPNAIANCMYRRK